MEPNRLRRCFSLFQIPLRVPTTTLLLGGFTTFQHCGCSSWSLYRSSPTVSSWWPQQSSRNSNTLWTGSWSILQLLILERPFLPVPSVCATSFLVTSFWATRCASSRATSSQSVVSGHWVRQSLDREFFSLLHLSSGWEWTFTESPYSLRRYHRSLVPDYHLLGEMDSCVQTFRKRQVWCQMGNGWNSVLLDMVCRLVCSPNLWMEQVAWHFVVSNKTHWILTRTVN